MRQSEPAGGRTAHPRRAGSALWKLLLFVAGATAMLIAVAVRPVARRWAAGQSSAATSEAQAALDEGDVATALKLAQVAVERARRTRQMLGESLILLGLVRERQAELAAGPDRVVCFTAATQRFEEALAVGVPNELRPKLTFHLAKCLHARNQFAEAVPLLEQSVMNFPAGRAEALHLLTLFFLRPESLDLQRAYRVNSELLRTTDATPELILEAWTDRAKIIRQLGRSDLLRGVDAGSTRADFQWVSQLMSAYTATEEKQYDAAISGYKKLLAMRNIPAAVERRCWFLIGLAARDRGDAEEALATFRTVEWRYPRTEEARAAAAHSAAILLHRDQTAQAIEMLSRAATQPDSATALMGRAALGRLIATALNRLRDEKQFDAAVDLLEVYRRVESAAAADLTAATLYEAWASAVLRDAEKLAPIDAERARYRAAELYRAAGTFVMRVADAAAAPENARSQFWRAAQNFVRGDGHLWAVAAIDRFLASGVTGDLRAQALARLCEALEGSGQPDQVEKIAEICTSEFPQHPATLKAIYHLARCEIAAGTTDRAAANLGRILADATSETDPHVIQKSRLYLAHLLCDQSRHDEAIPYLRDLLAGSLDRESFPDATVLLSECLRVSATRPTGRITSAQSPEVRAFYRRQKERELDEALNLLSSAERDLAAQERLGQLTNPQAEVLRQCRWNIAECLYEAERYEDALALYEAIAQTYSDLKVWLEAHVQLANCHYRLGRADEARQVLRTAKARLDETPEDVVEQARVDMAPERWKEWVEWLRRL